MKKNKSSKISQFFRELRNTRFFVSQSVIEKEISVKIENELNALVKRNILNTDVFKKVEEEREFVNRISVSTAEAKNYILGNDWFTAEEITYYKPKGVKTTLENFYTGNYSTYYRELTPDRVRIAQDACFARLQTDPMFSGAIQHLCNYTIGSGVQTTSPVAEINDVISTFLDDVKEFTGVPLDDQLVIRYFVEGEQFACVDVDFVTNDCTLDFYETYQIVGWEYHPKIKNLAVAYLVDDGDKMEWIQDYRYQKIKNSKNRKKKYVSKVDKELVQGKYIFHLKNNVYPEFRGRPPGLPALKYLKYSEDFLYDRILLNHERSRVVWLRTILGRAASNLANYLAAPPGGVMLNQTEDVKYDTVNPKINADDVKEDYLSIVYQIASAFLMPIHVLNMRANEQVYSSVLSAKAPFTKAIEKWQAYFDEEITKILKFVIEQKVASKSLKKSYTLDVFDVSSDKAQKKEIDTIKIPIYNVFPNPVDEKLSERTTHQNFLIVNKIVSMRTIREQEGFDHYKEMKRIEDESDEYKEMMTLRRGKTDSPDGSDPIVKKQTANVGQTK